MKDILMTFSGAFLLLLANQAEAQTCVETARGRLPEGISSLTVAGSVEGSPLILFASGREGRGSDIQPFLESARFTIFDSDGRELPVTFRPMMSFQDTSTGTRNRTRLWRWYTMDHLSAGTYRIQVNYRLSGIESEHSAETKLEIFGADDRPYTRIYDVSQIRAKAEVELLADMGALPQAEMRALELLGSHPNLFNLICYRLSLVYWEVGLLDRALFFMNEYLIFHRDAHNTSASPVPFAYSNLVQECGLAETEEEGSDLFDSRVDDILAGRVQSRLTREMLTPVLGGDLLAARAEEEFARQNRLRLIAVALSSFLAGMAAVGVGARLVAAGRRRESPFAERYRA